MGFDANSMVMLRIYMFFFFWGGGNKMLVLPSQKIIKLHVESSEFCWNHLEIKESPCFFLLIFTNLLRVTCIFRTFIHQINLLSAPRHPSPSRQKIDEPSGAMSKARASVRFTWPKFTWRSEFSAEILGIRLENLQKTMEITILNG